MPRAKKAPSAPLKTAEVPAKRVASVNPDPSNGGVKTNGDLEAAIRARAYELYEQRGRTEGLAQEDWVRAEREVLATHGKRTA